MIASDAFTSPDHTKGELEHHVIPVPTRIIIGRGNTFAKPFELTSGTIALQLSGKSKIKWVQLFELTSKLLRVISGTPISKVMVTPQRRAPLLLFKLSMQHTHLTRCGLKSTLLLVGLDVFLTSLKGQNVGTIFHDYHLPSCWGCQSSSSIAHRVYR